MDIVEQLRTAAKFLLTSERIEILDEAADEIERLRKENEQMREALEEVCAYVPRAEWFNMTEKTNDIVDQVLGDEE